MKREAEAKAFPPHRRVKRAPRATPPRNGSAPRPRLERKNPHRSAKAPKPSPRPRPRPQRRSRRKNRTARIMRPWPQAFLSRKSRTFPPMDRMEARMAAAKKAVRADAARDGTRPSARPWPRARRRLPAEGRTNRPRRFVPASPAGRMPGRAAARQAEASGNPTAKAKPAASPEIPRREGIAEMAVARTPTPRGNRAGWLLPKLGTRAEARAGIKASPGERPDPRVAAKNSKDRESVSAVPISSARTVTAPIQPGRIGRVPTDRVRIEVPHSSQGRAAAARTNNDKAVNHLRPGAKSITTDVIQARPGAVPIHIKAKGRVRRFSTTRSCLHLM